MHAVWFEDISYNYVSYAQDSKYGKIGAGIQYLSYGSITKTDTTGTEDGSFTPSDTAVSVSYANKVKNIPVGATLKYISSKIDSDSASAIAVDLGAQYELTRYKLMLGAAVQNIGTKMKFITESPSFNKAIRWVVVPTSIKMMVILPSSRSQSATVSGIRSPFSSILITTNWPG